jgi:hypothetical protein
MNQNKGSDKKDESQDGKFLSGDFYLENARTVLNGLRAYYLNLKDNTQKEEMAYKLWDILTDLPVGLMRYSIKGVNCVGKK